MSSRQIKFKNSLLVNLTALKVLDLNDYVNIEISQISYY